MSDTTFGVKVPEELKEQITKLMQSSGLTGKDFMQGLINVYQLEKTKEQLPEVAQELKELQGLTQRIDNIYLNLGYRIENITKSQQEQMSQELSKKDSIISDLQCKINGIEADKDTITEAYNNMINQNNEYSQRVNELTDSNKNIKELVEEYKSKNDMLTSLVSEYKAAKEENEGLKINLNEVNLLNTNMNNESMNKDKEIASLNISISNLSLQLQELKQQNKTEKEELKSEHKSFIDELKEKTEVSIRRSIEDTAKVKNAEMREQIIILKEEHQEKIQAIQNEYAIKINEYQDKYKSLLGELEHLKAAAQKKEVSKKQVDK